MLLSKSTYDMKKLGFLFSLFIMLLNGCNPETWQQGPRSQGISLNSSIRAVQAISENEVWFAGSNGYWGYSTDGGASFTIDSIEIDNKRPHFRGIVVKDSAILLLAISEPAAILRTTDRGQNWTVVHQAEDLAAFYNAIAMDKQGNGYVVGDPTNSCLTLLQTDDYGQSWSPVSCEQLPPVIPGEAGFAASNSNITILNDHIWIITGGTASRVMQSKDAGETWSFSQTPIQSGGQMTGIYAIDMLNESEGIIVGGDWDNKDLNFSSKAVTKDGGETWSAVGNGMNPGYQSDVQYNPANSNEIYSIGSPGLHLSKDAGKNWEALSPNGLYTLSFAPNGKRIWFGGDKKLEWLDL